MHHAQLDLGQRPSRPDRLGEPFQPVAADDERVGDTAVAELGEHRHPKLRAFTTGRADPHAEHVALTVEVDAHRHIHRPISDLAVTDLDHDRVDQDHRIHPSSGRFCQATMSSTIASVIRLIVSRLMSVP